MGAAKYAQGQVAEAEPLFNAAASMLMQHSQDAGLAEAQWYLALLRLVHADSVPDVVAVSEELSSALQRMVAVLGAQSMIVSIAVRMHTRTASAVLDKEFALGEWMDV